MSKQPSQWLIQQSRSFHLHWNIAGLMGCNFIRIGYSALNPLVATTITVLADVGPVHCWGRHFIIFCTICCLSLELIERDTCLICMNVGSCTSLPACKSCVWRDDRTQLRDFKVSSGHSVDRWRQTEIHGYKRGRMATLLSSRLQVAEDNQAPERLCSSPLPNFA